MMKAEVEACFSAIPAARREIVATLQQMIMQLHPLSLEDLRAEVKHAIEHPGDSRVQIGVSLHYHSHGL